MTATARPAEGTRRRRMETGRAAAAGWAGWISPPSKAGQVAAVKVLARELAGDAAQRDILVNAAYPGLVDTDASRPWFDDTSGALSPDEAAADRPWLATLPTRTGSRRSPPVRRCRSGSIGPAATRPGGLPAAGAPAARTAGSAKAV
jgi:NAD(P)-dependent dehydrogenase (short-subunit alcohol dehydrogenase family)